MDDDDEEFARDGKNIRRLLNLNFFYNAATSTYKNKNCLRRAVRRPRRRALVSAIFLAKSKFQSLPAEIVSHIVSFGFNCGCY